MIAQGAVIWFHTITGLHISLILEPCFYLCYSKFKAITQGQQEERERGNKRGPAPTVRAQIPCVLSWPDLVTPVKPPSPMGLGSQQLNAASGPAPTTGLDTPPSLVNTNSPTFHTGGIKQILTLPKNLPIKELKQRQQFKLKHKLWLHILNESFLPTDLMSFSKHLKQHCIIQ